MKSSLFSLISIASAVIVTQTEYNTFYVTVDANGDAIPATTSSSYEVPTTTSSSTQNVQNYAYTSSTTSSIPDPSPTTSSSSSSTSSSTSTTSSTSSTPVPVTTSSSSSTPVTTTSTSATAAPTLSDFEADMVNYHNRVRAEHQVGSVSWNSDLASYAQNYLDNSNCVFAHSGGPYGENIAIGFDTNDAALDAWYNEEDLYDYSAGQFSEATGHFTQMVWKGSNQIGCATVDCSGRTFLACEYTPRGNIIGEFTENVFPKSS